MRQLGILLMFLGVLAAVGGAWMFYESSQALNEVARLNDIPVIGWAVGAIIELVEAERIAQVKEIRSTSLLVGLGGAGAVLLGVVLVATNPSPSPTSQAAPAASRSLGERRGVGLHEWSFDGPDGAHHTVSVDVGKNAGVRVASVDGQIVQVEEATGLLNCTATFVVGEQIATLRMSASVSHTVVAKLFIGGRQIE